MRATRWSRSTSCTGIADSHRRPPPALILTGREWLASGATIPAHQHPPPEAEPPVFSDSDDSNDGPMELVDSSDDEEDAVPISVKVVNQDYDKEEKEEVSWSWLDKTLINGEEWKSPHVDQSSKTRSERRTRPQRSANKLHLLHDFRYTTRDESSGLVARDPRPTENV